MNAVAICQPGPGQPAVALVPSGVSAPATTAPKCTAAADAMGALWRLHGGALLRFALKLTLGNRQRAEDIVQEVLVRAWRNPDVVDGREHLIRPWLFTVTRHVAIDMWRARSRHEEVIEDEPTDRPDPAEHIEQTVTALDVRAAIAKLTPKHRQIVVEMFYYGRQVDEIAESLGIPAGTVKSRAYYALRHLKRLMSAPYTDAGLAASAGRSESAHCPPAADAAAIGDEDVDVRHVEVDDSLPFGRLALR